MVWPSRGEGSRDVLDWTVLLAMQGQLSVPGGGGLELRRQGQVETRWADGGSGSDASEKLRGGAMEARLYLLWLRKVMKDVDWRWWSRCLVCVSKMLVDERLRGQTAD